MSDNRSIHRSAPTCQPVTGAAGLAAALAERIEALGIELVGEQPTYRGRTEWRWYPRGGLAIEVAGDRRGIWCHHGAGGIGGDALDLVAHMRQCSLADAMQWARGWLGQPDRERPAPSLRPARSEPASTIPLARRIWAEGADPVGSPVETYLRSRCLSLAAEAPIRFHPACPRGAECLPAMIALMSDPVTAEPCGVHRTFLRPDGAGKIEAGRAKMMAGRAGVIRLVPDAEVTLRLGICEGIETGLGIMQHAGWSPVWTCASAGGIRGFPALAGIEAVTIYADRDDDGTGMDAAHTCADRWIAAGREATIELPPRGTDWLDALLPAREAARWTRGAQSRSYATQAARVSGASRHQRARVSFPPSHGSIAISRSRSDSLAS